jgi:hypothetical protein
MGVVTKYGTGYKDPAALKAVDAIPAEGRLLCFSSIVAVANGDSATSQLFFGRVPSNAIILPISRLDYSAITGLTSLDIGFAASANALVSALTVAAAGTTLLGAGGGAGMGIAKLGLRAWQMATLAADPGGMLDIVGTMNQAAAAAGTIVLSLLYARK